MIDGTLVSNLITMNHIFELSHSTLARIPFFKILLFVLLLGVERVNGQIATTTFNNSPFEWHFETYDNFGSQVQYSSNTQNLYNSCSGQFENCFLLDFNPGIQYGYISSPIFSGNNEGLISIEFRIKVLDNFNQEITNQNFNPSISVSGYSQNGVNISVQNLQYTRVGGCFFYSGSFFAPFANGINLNLNCSNSYSYSNQEHKLQFSSFQISQGQVDCSSMPNYNYSLISRTTTSTGQCPSFELFCPGPDATYTWKRDGQLIPGANQKKYTHPSNLPAQPYFYTCDVSCPTNNQNLTTNSVTIQGSDCISDFSSSVNYMLIQNVTTSSDNIQTKKAQIQFDLNWGFSWKDNINWDAAWIFMKYKTASGEWKHCKISNTGFDHGQGTPNIIEIPSDQMGAFVRLDGIGNAHIDIQGLQLQWDYSAEGISNVNGLEVKVFAIEMVYMPEGDFCVYKEVGSSVSGSSALGVSAPGGNEAVINNRMTPILTYNQPAGTCRVKGDVGLDSDADGVVDKPNYPTGYKAFYAAKYEMSEQQYADFLNCLTSTQKANLGVAGSTITLQNGVYLASNPIKACGGYNINRFLAYADWTGLRPLSILELSKMGAGPYRTYSQSVSQYISGLGNVGSKYSSSSTSGQYWSGYYGVKDLFGNASEPIVLLSSSDFSSLIHGNGTLSTNGTTDVVNWSNLIVKHADPYNTSNTSYYTDRQGFRFVRTAE
jgi:hypothetical protein